MSPPIRIAYVGPVPPNRGGIAQHGAKLVDALRTAGASVDVWSWRRQYPSFLYPGVEFDPTAGPFEARRVLRWWDPVGWLRVGAAVRGADALVFPWVTPVHAVPIRAIRAASGVRSIAVIHNPLPHERRPGDTLLTNVGLASLDGAICHTEDAAGSMRTLLPDTRIIVAAHPPNLDGDPDPSPAPPPPLRLLMPGFVRPYKGLDDALDAVALARKDGLDVVLTVAGEFWDPPVDAVRAAIDERGLTEAVSLEPVYVSDERLQQLLASSHATILPYREATQSGLIPLSLAAGRPVIASDAGGLPQQVRPGVDAIVSRRGDPDSLAGAMATLASDYERYASAAGEEVPSWEEMAAAVLDLARGR